MFGDNYIKVEVAKTIQGLFRARVNLSPNVVAFTEYDEPSESWQESTWHEMGNQVIQWQQLMLGLGLKKGDHVSIMAGNGRNWVRFDQAALGLGLVTVPLYVEDRADNIAYIIENADVKALFVDGDEQWSELFACKTPMPNLKHIISFSDIDEASVKKDKRLQNSSALLKPVDSSLSLITEEVDSESLATIVYTSGTTGKPKGVMLSHKNMLTNSASALKCAQVDEDNVFLSFLPLSHMLERSAGYYLPVMAGASIAYTRGIAQLGEDLMIIKPTILISVPRIYEKVFAKIQAGLEEKSKIARFLFNKAVNVGWERFEYQQGRRSWFPGLLLWPLLNKLVAGKILAKLGGRMTIAISGGAPLPPDIAKVFIGLGLPLLQGYGLTETSPILTVNRPDANIPHSIGQSVPGVSLRIAGGDELQAKGDNIMLGYWKNEKATTETFEDGWLQTGDCARVDDLGYYYITGRIKDILVLANGEKVPPADMEMALAIEPLFENVLIVGEGRSHITALMTLEEDEWAKYKAKHGFTDKDLASKEFKEAIAEKISERLAPFPGYAVVKDFIVLNEHWTVEGGLVTPTMKVKRPKVLEKYSKEIEEMYENILNRYKK